MLKKLLCVTDGSHASEKAVEFAVAFVKVLNAASIDPALVFLTVNTVSEEKASHTHFWDDTIIGAADAQVHQELYSAQLKATEAGLSNVTCVTANGRNIAAAIIDYAEKEGCDHIITGSTGRTGVSRLLLGSVASEVVTKAHCPVTVVR